MVLNTKEFIKYRKELHIIEAKLNQCPGNIFSGRLRSLKYSFAIFDKNLSEFIEATKEDNKPKLVMPIDDPRNTEIYLQYLNNLSRLLHNLLASVQTLVDHTRKVKGELSKHCPEFGRLYHKKSEEVFANSPLTNFVQDFRNYFLHIGLINFQIIHELNLSKGLITKYEMKPKDWIAWKGWSAKSREYINALTKDDTLQETFMNYRKHIIPFYNWLTEIFKELFSAEINEMIFLTDQYNSLLDKSGLLHEP